MIDFIARRLIAIVPVLTIVAVLIFMMLRLTPGDPAAVIAGDNATSDQIADIREKLGLNLPLWQQFGIWIGNILQGNFGESFFFKKTVAELIAQRIEPTLALGICTIAFAIVVAVPIGVMAAYKQGSLFDRCVMGFAVIGFSVPGFVIGYCLIYVFAIELGWLPVQGYKPLWGRGAEGLWGWMRQLILPWTALGLIYIALIARVTRASVSESLTEDHIRTARAKGLSEVRVLLRHALAHAAVPIVTVIGIGVALLIGGVVVTETVFAIPGLGSLTVDAVLNRDFPVIQGLVLLFSLSYVLINLLVDSSYVWLDPRIRH